MDGTEKGKDALQATVDSSSQTKGTSTETPETFTKAERDKAVSDALSKAGREAKATLLVKEAEWQKQKDEAEEYALRDQPEELTALRTERKRKTEESTKATELADRESKVAERETEFADIIERDRILKRTELAAEVAVEKGVSIDAILKLAKEDTRKAYEEVAEVLPKVKGLPVLTSDSGRMNRGGIDWRALSPEAQVKYALEHQK
ncbi:MAG: hypothetical protein Q8K55_07020 [Gemmatimonadaceae bacterium]|nr:hypothetical protein [Gemmatimonadaceae bacterium]